MPKKRTVSAKPQPVRYEFFITVAVDIYEAAIQQGASAKGAVLVISQASLESGFAESAIKYGDYNLFGQMTLGSDFKRKTAHGKVKDFSKAGGYQGSMAYYFQHITKNQWSGLALIKRPNFTAQDIDDAFNTGTDYPTDKERHGGKYAYNSDMGTDGKNHYGAHLYRQMSTTKTRMVAALDYKLALNARESEALANDKLTRPTAGLGAAKPAVGPERAVKTVDSVYSALEADRRKLTIYRENTRLMAIRDAINTVQL